MSDQVSHTATSVLTCHRFALLLAALVGLIVIAPLFGPGPFAAVDVAVLFSIVVLSFALTATRKALTLAVVLVWVALTLGHTYSNGPVSLVGMDVALVVVCAFAVESTMRRALQSGTVGTEELCAAISAYVLLGIAWAAVYSLLQTLDPTALNIPVGQATKHWNALLYFSFATLTTLGYGDFAPTSDFARALASVQAITGTIYLAILIAHLVGNFKGVAPPLPEADEPSVSQLDELLMASKSNPED